MEERDGVKTYHATSREDWRRWLAENQDKEKNLWLVIYRKQSGIPSVYYDEAVDEAICFGWIDSKINKRDEVSFYQFFARRNPKSNWSKVNKEKVARLLAAGLIEEPGLKMIELAKQTGTWTALDGVEDAVIPPDLKAAFDQNPTAWAYFDAFPRSAKRGILEWLLNAKRPETREKRIREIVEKAEQNIRALFESGNS
ncbi:MAG: hypothetical protein EAZ89_02010 [Bacteroidetes bacterium]|nr:MAG: hypothetical protein EAZ89_02010 [Bacteroidota bacterium]